ncbi:MAG TPA: tripartite tricarboxylate transporter TctB family protein [Candidatus Acidoferrum sp.]|nr:tripartite tricarboxylate transporter TctB family protein [Candidatus Acidoferrum sp.]
MRRRELAAAAVLLAFGLFAVIQARGLRFGTVAAPGPGFFPLCLALALCVVGIGLVVGAWRAAPASGAPAPSLRPRRFAIAATLGSLLVYALVLEWLGFLLATFALLVFFFRVLQHQRWLVAVAGSLATSLVSYLVFKTWLGVNLPGGLLQF